MKKEQEQKTIKINVENKSVDLHQQKKTNKKGIYMSRLKPLINFRYFKLILSNEKNIFISNNKIIYREKQNH